jgi:hypothetical protein
MTKTELIDKYRDINVDHDWWVHVTEQFTEDMLDNGIEVERTYFSGFWSQGDGACFDGNFTGPEGVKTFMDKHFKSDEYPTIRRLLSLGGSVILNVRHSGRYYHENSIRSSLGMDKVSDFLYLPTDFHHHIAQTLDDMLDNEASDFEDDCVKHFQTYMRELYKLLEAEYDHQTSDEAVWESIVANELDDITEPEEL